MAGNSFRSAGEDVSVGIEGQGRGTYLGEGEDGNPH